MDRERAARRSPRGTRGFVVLRCDGHPLPERTTRIKRARRLSAYAVQPAAEAVTTSTNIEVVTTDSLRSRGELHLEAMQPLKAVVKHGRLVVDEPTELPDGTEIELLPVDDDLDPQERARLLQALDEGIEDFERGDHMDGFDFIARMRARREAANR